MREKKGKHNRYAAGLLRNMIRFGGQDEKEIGMERKKADREKAAGFDV